jgi:diacylglycerol kinase (ATP)
MSEKPSPKTGLARILAAAGYSAAGFRTAWRHEAAFRQELLLAAILLGLLCLLPLPLGYKALLFAATILPVIIELLNSALEAVVDLVSPDFHLLAKRAKDLGSAAVLLSLLLALALWGLALLQLLAG